jgi:hypothetical protein
VRRREVSGDPGTPPGAYGAPGSLECTVSGRPFDPTAMARRGRIGAFVTHSRHDPRETTRAARAAFLARFERDVDPDGTLPEAERLRRGGYARSAYFARLALASARTRRMTSACHGRGRGAVDRAAADEGRRDDVTAP